MGRRVQSYWVARPRVRRGERSWRAVSAFAVWLGVLITLSGCDRASPPVLRPFAQPSHKLRIAVGQPGELPKDLVLYERSLAVVIGIDRYGALPHLRSAESDARAMAAMLRARGFTTRLLLGPQATRARLAELLGDQLPQSTRPDDRVLVYFAGHGVSQGDGADAVGYLMPVDGDPKRPATTGLAMTEVVRWFGRYPAKHVMLLADACYSGLALSTRSVGLRPAMERYLEAISSRRVRVALVAGGRDEQANEWQGAGLFTHFVLRGIAGEADGNGDGVVTSDELVAFVKPEVARTAQQQWRTEQHPQSGRAGEGEFVFVGGRRATNDAKSLRPTRTSRRTKPALLSPPVAPQTSGTAAASAASDAAATVAIKRPRTRFVSRATYDRADVAMEREIQRALDAEKVTKTPPAVVRKAWCRLADRPGASMYRTALRDACAAWRSFEARRAHSSPAVDYVRLNRWLALPHVTAAARAQALRTFIRRHGSDKRAQVQVRAAVQALAATVRPTPGATSPPPNGFVAIAAGPAHLGTPPGSLPRDRDEHQRTEQVTRSFIIGKTEVTQGQWAALMPTNPSSFPGCGLSCPAENLTFWDALAFANASSRAARLPTCYSLKGCAKDPDGRRQCASATSVGPECPGYRLPSETEWEMAARAGTQQATYIGEIAITERRNAPKLDRIAWHGGHNGASYRGAADCTGWRGRDGTSSGCGPQPVGGLQPNRWGLYDMIGNVWEWVWPRDATPMVKGSRVTSLAISRGGGWYNDARDCRAANRFALPPNAHYFNVGLRLVRNRSKSGPETSP